MAMRKIIYPQVDYLMWKNQLTNSALARAIDVLHSTMGRKLRGESPLLLDEAIAIRAALGSDMPLEELFTREEAADHGLQSP